MLGFRKRIGGDPFGGFNEAGPKDGAQRLQHILHLVSSNGEHEKLTQVMTDMLYFGVNWKKSMKVCGHKKHSDT